MDRESAYENSKAAPSRWRQAPCHRQGAATASAEEGGLLGGLNDVLFGSTGPRGGGKRDGLAQTMAKSAVRTMGTTLGREILRGVMGSIFGGRRR